MVLCYKDIVNSIILSFSHLLLFLSRECMIEGLNRCLFCMLLSIQVQQTTRQIRIATTMKLVMKMDIKNVDWWYDNEKWIQSHCLEQKGNEMKSSNDNKMWINRDMSFVSNHWNTNSKQYPISNNTIYVYNWNDNRNKTVMRKRKTAVNTYQSMIMTKIMKTVIETFIWILLSQKGKNQLIMIIILLEISLLS